MSWMDTTKPLRDKVAFYKQFGVEFDPDTDNVMAVVDSMAEALDHRDVIIWHQRNVIRALAFMVGILLIIVGIMGVT